MGGGGEKMPGQYMGWWGNLGSLPQKGVTSYGLSNNRQKPLGGAFHNAIFNTFRRTRQQVLFWATPMIAAYSIMQWSIEQNEHFNSKQGRAEFAGEEE